MKKIKYEMLRPFGPSIFKVKIPDEIINSLNEYVDNVAKDNEISSKLNYGESLVGDVTQEFKLEENFIKESGWSNFLSFYVSKWIEMETKKKITVFKIKSSWIVRQFENEYNPIHWHSGHISGAGFLKVPKNLGKHFQNKTSKEYHGGYLQLIHGSRMFCSDSLFNIMPEVGDFYFFPNYLMHTVYPFKDSMEERRSISFNAVIDEKIFDSYEN